MTFAKILICAVTGLAVTFSGTVSAAPNLVLNGGFELNTFVPTDGLTSSEFGPNYGGQNVTNWTSSNLGGGGAYNLYWVGSEALAHADIRNRTRFPGEAQQLPSTFSALSSNGGNFVFLDGDTVYNGPLSQTITGLTSGSKYMLTFEWAAVQLSNRSGAISETIQASLGAESFTTATIAGIDNAIGNGFSGWRTASFVFTAAGASELLSFLSLGTPNGLPPGALLDGVTLTEVPEPASMALIGMGLLGFGMIRRRKARLAA